MSKEKQIEEMARELNTATFGVNAHTLADHLKPETINKVAEYLYNAGYRKQSEGEWIADDDENGFDFYRCSKCHCEVVSTPNYCPDCGAKMKGGAE